MNFRQKINFINKLNLIVVITLALFFLNIPGINAQQTFWSRQDKIPEYEIENYEEPPFLISDQSYIIHAFNSQRLILGDKLASRAIFYRQWTLDYGWTTPNDILFDENGGNIELVGVSSDRSGFVHLVIQKNNNDLYYSNAFLSLAATPASWSEPIFIAGKTMKIGGGLPIIGSIVNIESANELVVVYCGEQYGNGVYFTVSEDKGTSWSEPYPIYLTGSNSLVAAHPGLYVGESGILHAVWTTYNENGFANSGYYSAWDSEKKSWSIPYELDTIGVDLPTVIEYNGDVFVAYYGVDGNRMWWRRLIGLGTEWTLPSLISPYHKGRNGAASFAVDSNDTLHVFFAERTDNNIHGVWHSIWTGSTWSTSEAVVRGPRVIDTIGGKGFDPHSTRAVVSNGNTILVNWGTDGGAGSNGAWYSYKILDTPELPDQPLPLPITQNADISPRETPALVNIPEENLQLLPDELRNKSSIVVQSPQTIILIGIVPAVILLIGVFILSVFYHDRADK